MEKKARIGILRWEKGHVPKGLLQLEEMQGNSTNPESYTFPVKMAYVDGACVETIITNPSQKVLNNMIEISKSLVENEGIEAITTSCGFNAIFQQELNEAVSVPVFTSAILQIPFIKNIIGKDQKIGVITANGASLTKKHFKACGVENLDNIVVMGLEKAEEWNKIFDNPDEIFDVNLVEQEIVGVARQCVEENPDIGAILLECTDLPPYADVIREAVNLPVFDFISMMNLITVSLGVIRPYK